VKAYIALVAACMLALGAYYVLTQVIPAGELAAFTAVVILLEIGLIAFSLLGER
jgi:hypothetical protein